MDPCFCIFAWSLLYLGVGAASYKTYEVTNVRSIRPNYVKSSALHESTNGDVKERQRRFAALGALSSAMNAAGQFASVAGAGGQIAGVVGQFKQLALQREQMKIQEEQFQKEVEFKTIDLCSNICVTNWGPWASCSARCGGGTTRRTRKKFESAVCKGKPCPHNLEEVANCNTACANGGTPSGKGTCKCRRGLSGPCCNDEIICEFPGNPRHGSLAGMIPTKFGGVVGFSCSDGYALVGDEHRVCEDKGRWRGSQPKCEKITCADPDEPQHGQNLNKRGIYQFGEEVVYRCNHGYVLTGPEKRKCTTVNGGSDGVWTGFAPLCLPVNCDDPGHPLHGKAEGAEFTLEKVVKFSCQQGYRLIGSEMRKCGESGKWSGHEATCELITCEEPQIPRHGQLRRSRETYHYGIKIKYVCEEGFVLEGNSTAMCVEDNKLSHLGRGGKWSSEPPTCKPTNCGDPGSIENGAKDGSLFYYPNNVTFICFDGFILQGAAEIQCGYNGIWSASPPRCASCPVNSYKANSDEMNKCLPCPENTHTVTNASNSAQQCICNPGWTGQPGGPCTEIICPVLTAPLNGQETCEGNKYTDKCQFSCETGYILDKGSSLRTCQDTGDWTGTDAQCSACPINTYKSDERSCLPCPIHSHTKTIASVKKQCICDDGFQGPLGGPCVDTNECLANGGRGPCEDVCRNTMGSYVCECSIPGYVIDTEVDRHVCKLDKSCRNLTEVDAPDNGGLVCHWYYEQNSQQCSIRCNPGYEFPARTNNYESCGPSTGYKWTHEERKEIIEPCIEEMFPDFRLEGNSSYFVRNCRDMTPNEQDKVKEDFAKMLTAEGICVKRATKVCDARNVGIICGATRRRRRRGVVENVDEVSVFFDLAAKEMLPSECDRICPFLRIPEARCEKLCVPTYRRYLKGLMLHTKRSVVNLFRNARKVNFKSAHRVFEYSGTLETSDVIIDCASGMKKSEICAPCNPGTFYSETENECVKCPEHTYQANPQQTSCVPCPRGTYAPKAGSAACSSCPDSKWGDKCQGTCHCEHGQCDPASGRCVCYSGWEGPECNIDIQSCTVDSCYPGVKCHDIPPPGTGFRCDPCPPGFQGDGTICEPQSSAERIDVRSLSDNHDIVKPASLSSLAFGDSFL